MNKSVAGSNTQNDNHVGILGIILAAFYLIVFSLLLIYSIVQFWPLSTSGSDLSSVKFLGLVFTISHEIQLLLVVVFAGALGSLVHSLRSFYWYLGHKDLRWPWLMMYLLLPFIGATLGLVFYFVIRGGFFSSQTTVQETNPFSFAALAALAGLFSEQALLRLKEVAEVVLAKPKPGDNARPQ